jgi:hypothetical protein
VSGSNISWNAKNTLALVVGQWFLNPPKFSIQSLSQLKQTLLKTHIPNISDVALISE